VPVEANHEFAERCLDRTTDNRILVACELEGGSGTPDESGYTGDPIILEATPDRREVSWQVQRAERISVWPSYARRLRWDS